MVSLNYLYEITSNRIVVTPCCAVAKKIYCAAFFFKLVAMCEKFRGTFDNESQKKQTS